MGGRDPLIIPQTYRQQHWVPTLDFTQTLLKANLRSGRSLVISLFTPLLLLGIFSLTGSGQDLRSILPFVIGLTVMFSGSALATRIVDWRNQKIFQRLAVTPVPLGYLMLGMVLAQLVVSIAQSVLVLVASIVVAKLELEPNQILLMFFVIVVGSLCFIGFGALLATFATKPDMVNSLYVFTLLPMAFLGGSVIHVPVLGDIGQFFPTTLLTELFNITMGAFQPDAVLLRMFGLAIYTLVFVRIAMQRFRWD